MSLHDEVAPVRILVLNGPNMNLLGTREPEVYGHQPFEAFFEEMRGRFSAQAQLEYTQSNVEGELINALHAARGSADAVVLNAGAYTHTSIAIADAVGAIGLPVVEVHISNVLARESYRKTSYTAARCLGSISGLGLEGYALAIHYLVQHLRPPPAQKVGN